MIELHEEHKSYYNAFLEILKAVSDDKNPGKYWFVELSEQFISPCEMVVQWKPLSNKQHQDLQKLYDMVLNYDEYHPDNERKTDEEICNDPEWHKIREYAKVVYNDLKNVKYIPDEKNPK